MKEICGQNLEAISGGVNLGTVIAALVVGTVTGGPAGLGIAACGLVINQGVNGLVDLHEQHQNNRK